MRLPSLRLRRGIATGLCGWTISNALADLLEAERRTANGVQLISRGYARGAFGRARDSLQDLRISRPSKGVAN